MLMAAVSCIDIWLPDNYLSISVLISEIVQQGFIPLKVGLNRFCWIVV